ncbi:hypothetical protein EDC01DRAFT_626183 [Geopyxis carbonaria]|nr:hypothetical protein EDC01DRAFT_626183 [Geopyxis carbonaria]
MVTGIETAGLVLAAFPLIVKALSSYAEGCGKIQEMFQHHTELRKFAVELKTEYTKFHNTCQNLLEDIVSPEESDELLNPKTPERGTELWSSNDLRKQLETKLRKRTVEAFLNSVFGLEEVLKELYQRFPTQDGKKGSKKQAKKFITIIRFSVLSTLRKEKMAEVRQRNTDLESLSLRGCKSLDDHVGSKYQAAATVKFYLKVQKHAKNLLTVLKEKLAVPACSCMLPHDAVLQLEFRSHKKKDMRFRTFISFKEPPIDHNWREVDVEPVDNIEDFDKGPIAKPQSVQTTSAEFGQWSKGASQSLMPMSGSPLKQSAFKRGSFVDVLKKGTRNFAQTSGARTTTIQIPSNNPTLSPRKPVTSFKIDDSAARSKAPKTLPIDEFCKTIIAKVLTDDSCYGHLVDKENLRHRVWPPKVPVCNSSQFSTVTLLELFQRQYYVSKKQRLLLGIKLASSVLQLHSSGWLREDWSSEDIVFFENSSTHQVLFDHPIVHCADPTTKENSKWLVPCNKTLFSLGIILIELYYGRCLDQCPGPVSNRQSTSGINETLRLQLLADEMVNVVYDDAGTSYGDAVRRCIRGVDYPDRSLEKSGFKEEVYRVVLCPLETSMEMFKTGN